MSKSVAIVTGASSGIGRATALRLAQDFSTVVLVARRLSELDAVADQVRAAGAEPLALAGDLSTPAAPEQVVARTLEAAGRIDALLNIAGAVPGLDLFQMDDAQWDAAFALKFHGARRLTLRAWDALKAARGSVVLISGATADAPTAAQAAVGTINAAIEAMMKAFADRGIADGVQVNAVSPGAVMTDRRMGMIQAWAAAHDVGVEAAKATLLMKAGIGRYGTPEEIANLMAYLVSPPARWMTGSVLRMDGGETRSI
ncbi:MAG: SDR family oxidoreductase [Caulobacteraceae bacterium]